LKGIIYVIKWQIELKPLSDIKLNLFNFFIEDLQIQEQLIMKRILSLYLLLSCTVVYGQYQTEIHVVQDGTGDFTTIQEAIDEAKSFPDTRITIYIKNGVYEEKVKVHAWNSRLTLKGESTDGVIVRWNDYFAKINRGRNSTFHTATLLVQGDDFRAENLTIENTAGPVGHRPVR
jgi:pectinesterase